MYIQSKYRYNPIQKAILKAKINPYLIESRELFLRRSHAGVGLQIVPFREIGQEHISLGAGCRKALS